MTTGKRRNGQVRAWLAIFLSMVLTGCIHEEIEQQLHEPGVYKGKPDPLLEKSGSQEFAAKLEQRLNQVQTDR